MKTRVLVTGATGTLGTEVLHQLAAQSGRFEISAFDLKTQENEKKLRQFDDRIKIFYGDITKPVDTVEAAKNQDVVIHLAALIPPAADRSRSQTMKVNYEGTIHLIKNLETHSPDCFLAYSSSVSVYGDRLQSNEIRADDALNPSEDDFYAESKIKAERAIQSSKLRWTIFRLSAVMGVRNHKISGLMFLMPLETPLEIITPEDAARAYVQSIGYQDVLDKKIFNLGGGAKARISYHDFLRKSFRLYGLGQLNFPNYAFATHNYHCGHYADGDLLEEILRFRRTDIEKYFRQVSEAIPGVQRFFTRIVSPFVKRILLKSSEPYQAYKSGDEVKMQKYF